MPSNKSAMLSRFGGRKWNSYIWYMYFCKSLRFHLNLIFQKFLMRQIEKKSLSLHRVVNWGWGMLFFFGFDLKASGGLVAKSCPTLWDPMDYSLPGSSVHGIFQARNTRVGCHFLLQGIFLTRAKPVSLASAALAGRFFTIELPIAWGNFCNHSGSSSSKCSINSIKCS